MSKRTFTYVRLVYFEVGTQRHSQAAALAGAGACFERVMASQVPSRSLFALFCSRIRAPGGVVAVLSLSQHLLFLPSEAASNVAELEASNKGGPASTSGQEDEGDDVFTGIDNEDYSTSGQAGGDSAGEWNANLAEEEAEITDSLPPPVATDTAGKTAVGDQVSVTSRQDEDAQNQSTEAVQPVESREERTHVTTKRKKNKRGRRAPRYTSHEALRAELSMFEGTREGHEEVHHIVHDWFHSIGFAVDEYARTHDELLEGHHNVMFGSMRPGCRAQKYRAPNQFPHQYWFNALFVGIGCVVAFAGLLVCWWAKTVFEVGSFGLFGTSAGKEKYQKRHRIKTRVLHISLVALPMMAAVCYREWAELAERWHDRREILILSVVTHLDFKSAEHRAWLEQLPYNFLGVDCPNLEVAEHTPGSLDSAWTVLPLASWALDHTWKHHKYVYWADPAIVPVHSAALRIQAHEHMEEGRLLVVDEQGGMLLHTGPLSRDLLSKARVLCKSPVEHPFVALLALAVGGDSWHAAVDKVATQTEEGRWMLRAIETKHAKVLMNLTLPMASTEPWCEL
ncbi:unnamed protein product [Amoebophrya sp. A120]|nr:unnamed protein product [Amoebophrya sp. A120]|eukprot:GSA120T00017901001.1